MLLQSLVLLHLTWTARNAIVSAQALVNTAIRSEFATADTALDGRLDVLEALGLTGNFDSTALVTEDAAIREAFATVDAAFETRIALNDAKVGVTSLDATDAELSSAISAEGSRSNAYADQAEADAKAYADTNDNDTVAFADTANSRIDFGNGNYLNFGDIDTDTNLSQNDVATYATAEGFVHSSSIAAETRILADGSVYVHRHPGSPHWDLDGISGDGDQTVEEYFFTARTYTTQAALTTANLGLAIASTNTTATTAATAAAADLAASSTLTADDSNQNTVILDNQSRLDSIGTSDYRVKEIWD